MEWMMSSIFIALTHRSQSRKITAAEIGVELDGSNLKFRTRLALDDVANAPRCEECGCEQEAPALQACSIDLFSL